MNTELKRLNAELDELKEITSDLARYTMLPNYDEAKAELYYSELNRFRSTHKRINEILDEQRAARNADRQANPSRKTFVNSYGEATTRNITSATYERQQKCLSKQLIDFIA